MRYGNYDMRDKQFWKSEKTAGEALVKIAKDKYKEGDRKPANELLGSLQHQRLYVAQVQHELKVARKYLKMAEDNWQDFYECTQQ